MLAGSASSGLSGAASMGRACCRIGLDWTWVDLKFPLSTCLNVEPMTAPVAIMHVLLRCHCSTADQL